MDHRACTLSELSYYTPAQIESALVHSFGVQEMTTQAQATREFCCGDTPTAAGVGFRNTTL